MENSDRYKYALSEFSNKSTSSENFFVRNLSLKFIIFIFVVTLGLYFAFFSSTESGKEVDPLVTTAVNLSEKKYKDTMLKFYDPELNWSFHNATKNPLWKPEIQGQGGILIDSNTGLILYDKQSNEKRKIASLTKVMTAVIALEHAELNKKIKVSKTAADINENTMDLDEDEIYTLEELLYGLVLHSGNDAAYAISEGVAGDTKTFVEWMNIKAKELGLENTYFADPSGLDDTTYSTPADLVKLTRYAMKNPTFKEIVKTTEKELSSDTHKYLYLENQTNLLKTYPGVEGVKTGYTEEAGLCLITYAKNDGKEVIGVVLNSTDRKGDMILMLDHGFAQYGIHIEHHLLDPPQT